jgi:branched-chain amino acid transport system permease protein
MQRFVQGTASWFTTPMLVTFAFFGTMPLWIEPIGLYSYLGVEVLIWVIFALGFNLLLGYTGLPSFGHGAFLGIGGYAFGWFQFNVIPGLWPSLIFAVLVTAAIGGVVALALSHRRGIYYALLTIAVGQIFFFIASKWTSLTGGEDGMLSIARLPVELGVVSFSLKDNNSLYYFTFAVFVVLVIFLWRLVNSPFGRVIKAIKQNEMRVGFLGYNVYFFKWAVFTISCAVAGLAGGLFAMAQEGAYVQVMSLQWSGIIVLMTLIGGGFVSFWGPVIGTVFFFLARDVLGNEEIVGSFAETWLLWYGLTFVIIVMFKPDGIAGMWQDLMKKRGKKSTDTAPAPLVANPARASE